MKKQEFRCIAHIMRDLESGMYIGFVPEMLGAHTQGRTLDEVAANLQDMILLCLEGMHEEKRKASSEFVAVLELKVRI